MDQTDGQTSAVCWADAGEMHMENIKHRTKVAPKIQSWNQSTMSSGEKMPQLCISSHQQVSCDCVCEDPRNCWSSCPVQQLPAGEAAWGLCNYPLPLPCACCRVELSVFQGGKSSKDGATLLLTPSREKGWELGGLYSLFHHKTLSFESWQLAWLWLLLGSSLLRVTVLQSEQTLALACWMFCQSACVVWHRKALVTIGAGGKMHTATFTLTLSKILGTCVSWLMIEEKWERSDQKNQTKLQKQTKN